MADGRIEQLFGAGPATAPIVVPPALEAPPGTSLVPEDVPALPVGAPPGTSIVEGPPGTSPVAAPPTEPEEPGVGKRIVSRFLGTDMDVPLEYPRLGSTIAGALAFGATGTKLGIAAGAATGPAAPIMIPVLGTAGTLIGGATGAYIGTRAPEGAMEIGELIGVLEEGTRDREGLSPEELNTLSENEALLDFATGGGLTILRVGGRTMATAFTGARKPIAEAAARLGIDMMPVQVGDRVIGRGYTAVLGRFPWLGGGRIRRTGAKVEEQFREVAASLTERIGPLVSGSDLGTQIFGDAKTLLKETNRKFGREYEKLFRRAADNGIVALTNNTKAKAGTILAEIQAKTPAQHTADLGTGAGPVLEKMRKFLAENISDLTDTQTLKQMDGLIQKIDQEIASLEPGQKRFVLSRFMQLRQAAAFDAVANLRGPGAHQLGLEMRALDAEFSQTMSQVFETATAKRMQSVQKRGIRALEFDAATRIPVDKLARTVVDLESPQAIRELAQLATPETMQAVSAHVIEDAYQAALKTEGFVGKLDIDTFARKLGLDGHHRARRSAVAELLKQSNSSVTIQDLDDMVKVGQVLSGFDIPNVNTFIARRAGISGIQGIINGVVPTLALAGGAGAAAWSGVPFIGMATFIGGSNLVGAIIANPLSARALHTVFDKEASRILRNKAFVSALRIGIEDLVKGGQITKDRADQLWDATRESISSLADQYDILEGKE